jgi:hypothetical protein
VSGRIRTIKPEWLEDEQLAEAGTLARLLSVSLIVLADDHGRGRANEVVLAAKVFTYEADPVGCIREALARLSRINFVRLYTVRGQRYYQIRNWVKHQRVDKPGKPRFPGPEEADEESPGPKDPPQPTTPNEAPRESLATNPEVLAPDLDLDQGPRPRPRTEEPQSPRAPAAARNLAKLAWCRVDARTGGDGQLPASHDQELLALSQQAQQLASTIADGDAMASLEHWAETFMRTARRRHVAAWVSWCATLSAAGNLRPVAKVESTAEAQARIEAKRAAQRAREAAPPPESLRQRFRPAGGA